MHLSDVVKLSDEDSQWLYPGKDLEKAAVHILGLGDDLAVITQGSSGALPATTSGRLNIPAVKSDVADTIGAGHSYRSDLILGLFTRATDGLAPLVFEQLGRTAAMAPQ